MNTVHQCDVIVYFFILQKNGVHYQRQSDY